MAPRALKDSVRPRRLSGASVRPFNFTVRSPMNSRVILRVVGFAYASVGVLFLTATAFAAYEYIWWQFFRPQGSIGQDVTLPTLLRVAAFAACLCTLAWLVFGYLRLKRWVRLSVVCISCVLALLITFNALRSLQYYNFVAAFVLPLVTASIYGGGTYVLWRFRGASNQRLERP
jgi:hypothetical protein